MTSIASTVDGLETRREISSARRNVTASWYARESEAKETGRDKCSEAEGKEGSKREEEAVSSVAELEQFEGPPYFVTNAGAFSTPSNMLQVTAKLFTQSPCS